MHKFFANWYALAVPEPQSDTLDKRWAGIEAYCKDIAKEKAFELVRLFFCLPVRSDSLEEGFRDAFKNADSAFFMKNNALEVQVLAGSAIVHILDQKPSTITDVTALAVLCADCRNLRSQVLMGDVITYARDYAANESERVRNVDSVTPVERIAATKPEELSALDSSLKDGTLQSNPDALVKLLEKMGSACAEFSRKAENAISALNDNLEIQQEETNILWWLFGERSRDREMHVANIDLPGLCLLVGKELADLTILEPGARPAPAFLDRMLRTGRAEIPPAVTIADAVESSSRDWRRAWMNSSDPTTIGDLCPAHFATSKSLESETAGAWISAFETKTALKASQPLSPLDLAIQTYQEALLVRMANSAGKE